MILIQHFQVSPFLKKFTIIVLCCEVCYIKYRLRETSRLFFCKKSLAQRQLDSLDDMASRGVMPEDRYTKKSQALEAQIKKLETELHDTETRAKAWHKTLVRTLETCTTAAERFNNGNFRTRRLVLQEIGQNPTMKDGIPFIEPENWFQPIADNYPAIEAEYEKVRTAENLSNKAKTAALTTVYQTWLGVRDSNTYDKRVDNGISNYATLLAICGVNVSMILFGWLQEKYAKPGDKQWLPFIFGCIAGIIPWIIFTIQLITPMNTSSDRAPGFVYGIVISLFLLFNCFAIVQYLQYRAKGKWANYLRGEKAYIILSFVAKSLLAWQIFAGTLAAK